MPSDPVLCYVKDGIAYFTDQPLDQQWGDDWDDAPYEHNAEEPYSRDGVMITRVAWEGPFDEPCEAYTNSPYSVRDINAGAVAWLRPAHYVEQRDSIVAGMTLSRFVEIIRAAGGRAYREIVE